MGIIISFTGNDSDGPFRHCLLVIVDALELFHDSRFITFHGTLWANSSLGSFHEKQLLDCSPSFLHVPVQLGSFLPKSPFNYNIIPQLMSRSFYCFSIGCFWLNDHKFHKEVLLDHLSGIGHVYNGNYD